MTLAERMTVRFIVDRLRAKASEPPAVEMLADMLANVAGLDAPAPKRRLKATEPLAGEHSTA